MPFNELLKTIIVIALLIATIGTAYIFVVTNFFNDKSYYGFYSNWQFPMLLAIITEGAYVL